MSLTFNGLNGLSFGDGTSQNTAAFSSYRNKIHNGEFLVDQRKNGSAWGTTDQFTIDRWYDQNALSSGSVASQRVEDAPAGFYYSYKKTYTSPAYNSTSGYSNFQQMMEVQYLDDLMWGTASAKPLVVSFYAKSSMTGNHSLCLQNYASAARKSYNTSYTINSANTWEYKVVIIPGDTVTAPGAGRTRNGQGLQLRFSQGGGTQYTTSTTNTWQTADVFFTSGCVTPALTNGATWQIAGVQAEVGSINTPFERCQQHDVLRTCQRYYWQTQSLLGGTYGMDMIGQGFIRVTTTTGSPVTIQVPFPVPMRAVPSVGTTNGVNFVVQVANTSHIGNGGLGIWSVGGNRMGWIDMDVDSTSGFSVGQAVSVYCNSGASDMTFSAEI